MNVFKCQTMIIELYSLYHMHSIYVCMFYYYTVLYRVRMICDYIIMSHVFVVMNSIKHTYHVVNIINKYFEFKNSWGCRPPNQLELLGRIVGI